MVCAPDLAYTVEGFADCFYRDFNFISDWDINTTYNINDVVFDNINSPIFYKCLNNGVIGTSPPNDPGNWEALTIEEIKTARYISSKDINKAFTEAFGLYSKDLFCEDQQLMMFYYLTAHFLVLDLNAGGLNSTTTAAIGSKSVGNVSVSYIIPEWAKNNPKYSFFIQTYYGTKYITLASTGLIGGFSGVAGGTTPY